MIVGIICANGTYIVFYVDYPPRIAGGEGVKVIWAMPEGTCSASSVSWENLKNPAENPFLFKYYQII